MPAGAGFVGSLRARARGAAETDGARFGGVGPIHVPAAATTSEVQSEVDFWVTGAATHATPRRDDPPPPGGGDPAGLVADGGWFWGS
jgi:hypothetical protein